MQRLSRLSILSLGVWAIMALPSLAETLLYPSAQDKAIMVTGIGLIKAKATSAEVRLSIGEDFPLDAGTAPVPPKPISEKDLNAIVNSLVRSGLKPDQITARIGDATEDGPLVQAVILVKLENPTAPSLDRLLKAAKTTAEAQNLGVLQSQVSYSTSNCQALEQQAYEKAIQDAGWRAEAIAKATRQTLSSTPSVAEAFYNSLTGGCGDSNVFDLFGAGKAGGDRPEVTVRKDLMVTYPVVR